MCYAWFGIHVIGTIICFMLLIWVTKSNVTEYKSALTIAMACCLIALFSRCMYICADNLDTLLVLSKIEYLGKCYVNYCALVFIIKWKRVNCPKWLLNAMLFFNTVAYLIIATCQYHSLYYRSISIEPSRTSIGGYILVKENGWFYYVYMTFVVIELFACMALILRPVISGKLSREDRRLHMMILMAAIAPSIFLVLRIAGVFAGNDPTTLGILMTCIFWTIAVNISGLFDTVKSAKEDLVEKLPEGIIVSDNHNIILYYNPAASQILTELATGWTLEDVKKALGCGMEQESHVNVGGHYYETRLSEIKDSEYNVKGTMMTIIDITNMVEQNKQMQELKERAEDASLAKSIFLSNMSHEIRTPMNAIVGMTEILLREDLDDKEKEYLMNIKSSGKSLLTIVNDILDFSKIESGKMDIIPDNYETASFFNDLGLMFINRIGSKNVDLIMDIDPRLPSVLYGDEARVRQVIINMVNNAIKFTDMGYVRLKIEITDMTDDEVTLGFSVKDTGIGIKNTDIGRLFRSFEQINTRRDSKQEGTGLGLSVSQRLVELMGGRIEVESTFGVGSEFFFTLKQGVVNKKPAAEIRKRSDDKIPSVTCCMVSDYSRENFEKMAGSFKLPYVSYEDVRDSKKNVDYIFVDSELYQKMKDELDAQIVDEATVCVLNNPMTENKKIEDTLSTNRPVFTVNFAQMMNNEMTDVEVEDEYCLNFIAPAANILLVDDNEMNRKVAIGLLKPLLMHIDTAVDGRDAINMILKNKYDIVLMDHMMPVLDGVEATKELRAMDDEYCRTVPIIALTANAVIDARRSFIDAGMNGFVAKPIELGEMVTVLRRFLPQDKIFKQNAEVEMGSHKESIDDIPVIDGIEIKEGIKNSGSKEMFLNMLSDYYNIIDIKSSKIEQCLEDDMIKDLTIEVHALKNTSRLIGAIKMSNEFLRMEQLGNANDSEQLRRDIPAVLKMYKAFKDKLRSFSTYGDKDKKEVPVDELLTLLDDIRHAMDEFDIEKADAAMNILNECRIPEECQSNMELLRAYVSDVAMEDVMDMCEKIASQLINISRQ